MNKETITSFMRFITPQKVTLILFVLLLLLMPVYYVYFEPERTNFSPGEEQVWQRKSKMYTSVFDEFFYHTDGFDMDFVGIFIRDYIDNSIGFVLMGGYYFISCLGNLGVRKIFKN